MKTIKELSDIEIAKLFAVTLVESAPASVAKFAELKAALYKLYDKV